MAFWWSPFSTYFCCSLVPLLEMSMRMWLLFEKSNLFLDCIFVYSYIFPERLQREDTEQLCLLISTVANRCTRRIGGNQPQVIAAIVGLIVHKWILWVECNTVEIMAPHRWQNRCHSGIPLSIYIFFNGVYPPPRPHLLPLPTYHLWYMWAGKLEVFFFSTLSCAHLATKQLVDKHHFPFCKCPAWTVRVITASVASQRPPVCH